MPKTLIYDLTIGSERVTNKKQSGDRWISSLQVELGMNATGGKCVAELIDPNNPLPPAGEQLTLKMDDGEGEQSVFAGEVIKSESTATSQIITASDGVEKLGLIDIEAVYENMNADFIVKELIGEAGLEPGTIEKGPKFASRVLFSGPRALGHIRKLAETCGKDYYTDSEGKFHFAGPDSKGAEHKFQYGFDIQELSLWQNIPIFDGIEVVGEGAAGSEGAEKSHWLPVDLSGVLGKASMDEDGNVSPGKAGKRALRFHCGAARSQEDAEKMAESLLKKIASERLKGRLRARGRLGVNPGDIVKIEDIPKDHGFYGLLEKFPGPRIRGVKLFLTSQTGFVINLDF